MPEHGSRAYISVATLILIGGLSCSRNLPKPEQQACMATKTIQQVQEEHTDEWMAIPGVVGTAIGQQDGKPCILILTASNTEQVRQKIPSSVEGYPVVVRFVGEIRALDQ